MNLLGLPVIEALKLATRLDTATETARLDTATEIIQPVSTAETAQLDTAIEIIHPVNTTETARLDTTTTTADVVEKFSAVFQGLGNLGEPYDIQLWPDAKPYVAVTGRKQTLVHFNKAN